MAPMDRRLDQREKLAQTVQLVMLEIQDHQANRAVPVFRVRVVNEVALAVAIIVRRRERHPAIANWMCGWGDTDIEWYK